MVRILTHGSTSTYLFALFTSSKKAAPFICPRENRILPAYLPLHPTAHSREKLAALLWGDSSDTAARGSLRKALNLLRKHLGNEIIQTDREKVQLNPVNPAYALRADAVEFERQASQLLSAHNPDLSSIDFDLYQGELLSDFYDEWILTEREHYHTLCFKALLRVVEILRAQSEYEAAIQYAQRILKNDPANERAHQHLIFCHAASGDRDEALQQYEACRRVLERDLGVNPARETQGLYNWVNQSASDTQPLAARVTNLPIPISSFVGRVAS
jgi:DNA-binding SARP family transcriptional activator